MKKHNTNFKKYDYDAIIIGAGVGGLVSGCYLAKNGMRILIVEKNANVGGYCSSFDRDGFSFDACVHALGGCRQNGNVRKLITDLAIEKRLELVRHNPSDIIVTSEFEVKVMNDVGETISGLQDRFPHEAQKIKAFFDFMLNTDFSILFFRLKNMTFCALLLSYFKDIKLINVLSVFLANVGLPASMASAMTCVMLYREFVLDGGYYPKKGMYSFPLALSEKFKEYGGDLFLSREVTKIKIRNKIVEGVVTQDGEIIRSKYVISNSDVLKTFFNLVGGEHIGKKLTVRLNNMIPSSSAFLVYLGLTTNFDLPYCNTGTSLWYFPYYYQIEDLFCKSFKGSIDASSKNILCFSPQSQNYGLGGNQKRTLCLMTNVSYRTKVFWQRRKNEYSDKLIKRCEGIIPNLSSGIESQDVATPVTLSKYTFNNKGAAYGWAPMVSQINRIAAPYKTLIKNLFLAGHWTTQGHGIPMVVKSGMITANSILRRDQLCDS